jgi:tRNA pseudouridine38-40 synthase
VGEEKIDLCPRILTLNSHRLALKLEYDGAGFCGSQYQAGVRTVQEELEKALAILAKQPVRVTLAGRTDSGVHASGQVAHCDWPLHAAISSAWYRNETSGNNTNLPDLFRLCASINGILAKDLAVTAAQWISADFHARFSATTRSYAYKILNRPYRSPLLQDRSYFVPSPLNLTDMLAAIRCLVGEHDFSAFKSSNSDRHNSVCHVTHAEILNLGEGVLEFRIEANRFVYNMVRVIAGTLVEIGLGKRSAAGLLHALESKDRNQAGSTAAAWALCLSSVQYPDIYRLFKPISDSPPMTTTITMQSQESA